LLLKTVNQWIQQDYSRISRLDETFRAYDISLRDLNVAHFMDEAELHTLARSPLVTIGGHTTSHPPLSYLDADGVQREMTDNCLYLEGLLDCPVQHFAYPLRWALGRAVPGKSVSPPRPASEWRGREGWRGFFLTLSAPP
jgi:hypothetical protein